MTVLHEKLYIISADFQFIDKRKHIVLIMYAHYVFAPCYVNNRQQQSISICS